MKNLLLIIALVIFSIYSFSQSIDDALRYSQSDLSGTARYVSMGGAFGALGGDISAISDNPAATGVFSYSEFNITPTIYHGNTETNYYGKTSYDNKTRFTLNNIGFVGTSKIDKNNWKFINYAFSYKKLNNYNQNIYALGTNNNNSITDYFANEANGTTLYDLDNNYDNSYVGDNAYQSYLIDPVENKPSNTEYKTSYNNYGEVQINRIKTTGNKSDYSFAIGTNYNNKIYLGMSFNYSSVNYTYLSDFEEQDIYKKIDNFKQMQYKNRYTTSGYAYTFKIGLIVRPIKWLRISYAFHTPSSYNMTDNYSHSIQSWGVKNEGNVTNPYAESPYGLYEYRIITPMKMMAGMGFVIGKKATIGLEYEYLDYSKARISSRSSYNEFANDNAMIKDAFKGSHNVKAGFEYRLGQISIRTGASYFDSPYRPKEINKNAYTIYYSGGLGLNLNFFYANLAYSYGYSTSYYYPYQIDGQDTEPYEINKSTNKFIATIGVRF